jgi:multidrug transporter EmrE-like cation transporter
LIQATQQQKRTSILLVFCCTLLGAAAQVLIKFGAPKIALQPNVLRTVLGVVENAPLMAGLSLYGASTILLVLALRHGELSILYPVIALTFVWVAILSAIVIGEAMNPHKVAGIAIIVVGVSVLGMGGRR